MAKPISTAILTVNLDCRTCYKKICKKICKLRVREKIQTVAFDEKNTVTITGPFDRTKLCEMLCCKTSLCCTACKLVIDIQIKEKPPPPPPPTPTPPPPPPPPPDKPDKPLTGCQHICPTPICNCGCYGTYPCCGRGYGTCCHVSYEPAPQSPCGVM